MYLTFFSVVFLPTLGVLKRFQSTFAKDCDEYTDSDALSYKQIKTSSLVPAYIETVRKYLSIRNNIKRNINDEDISLVYKQKSELTPKEIHEYIENKIDDYGGRPEEVFRAIDWDDAFRDSNDRFFRGIVIIHKTQLLKNKKERLDTCFDCTLLLAIPAFLITLVLEYLSIQYKIFSIEISTLSFVIGFFTWLFAFGICFWTRLIKQGLKKVFNDATENTI